MGCPFRFPHGGGGGGRFSFGTAVSKKCHATFLKIFLGSEQPTGTSHRILSSQVLHLNDSGEFELEKVKRVLAVSPYYRLIRVYQIQVALRRPGAVSPGYGCFGG